jgi:hypothetical protein
MEIQRIAGQQWVNKSMAIKKQGTRREKRRGGNLKVKAN